MTERAIVQSAQQGNTEAFRMLFEQNRKRIFALAYQYTKNKEDAEDILQETFIKTYNYLDKYKIENDTSFSSWIYRIGINCSIDYLRKKKHKKEDFSDWDKWEKTIGSNHSNPEHTIGLEQLREKISNLVAKLSPRQRMVFILKHYQQFSIKEIAEYLDCSEGSVKKQLFRAVSAIRSPLKKYLWEKEYGMQKV
ncbi:MAG: RNA polymerase sigma factor [Candidatus Aminicenantes bacterium]|nr:MAG: RNA polymerase sigma factor [Candidatus Aminicenantes bacterium]